MGTDRRTRCLGGRETAADLVPVNVESKPTVLQLISNNMF